MDDRDEDDNNKIITTTSNNIMPAATTTSSLAQNGSLGADDDLFEGGGGEENGGGPMIHSNFQQQINRSNGISNNTKHANGSQDPAISNGGGGQQIQLPSANVNNNNTPTPLANNSANNGKTTTTNPTATKLNGLKNRIIQRPPPLILDKVSNFYDNETQSPLTNNNHTISAQQHQPSSQNNKAAAAASNAPSSVALQHQTNHINNNTTTTTTNNPNPNNSNGSNNQPSNSNSANHKFWASLNQNASRTRSAISLASGVGGGSRNQPENVATAAPIDSTDSTGANNNTNTNNSNHLGPDLIITHRNSNINNNNINMNSNNGNQAANRISSTNSAPSLVQQSKLDQTKNNTNSQQQLTKSSHLVAEAIKEVQKRSTTHEGNMTPLDTTRSSNPDNSMSNNSEFDDSSTHGGIASENDGGNLIGVDNPTPPASTTASDVPIRLNDEPPPSATGSRPRSNNPFLAMDEELFGAIDTHNGGSFHKRPASFIAATDGALFNQRPAFIDHISQNHQQPYHHVHSQQQHHHHHHHQQNLQDQFSSLHLDPDQAQLMPQYHKHHQDNIYSSERDAISLAQNSSLDQRDSSSIYQSTMSHHHQSSHNHYQQQQQQQQQIQSIYGVYGGQNYINYEPTISMDSESAVCKPPPSVSMQLPHWTDAIYALNNAILESSSVAGGAENGQFIYIVESGDIVLELDQIKVSGFTLVEFNELLDSKQVHLLNAVQTKHSHGLTTDLKHYLNFSFPKNSNDKELQDLIRENIYRRTIPCTTRPQKEGELDKVDYHFLTKEQFIEMNNRGMLLECGMHGGHYYGTMKPFSDLNSLSIYGSISQKEISDDMRQPLNANHPAIGLVNRKGEDVPMVSVGQSENPLYENHESLKMHQMQNVHLALHPTNQMMEEDKNQNGIPMNQRALPPIDNMVPCMEQSSIVAVDNEALPPGWERVIDQTHGTYYIDHNTQRTQYEQPYEIELTKGSMGFGFTLVETDSGLLLVRSVIPGGPAHTNGTIRPGDILISAVGVSVSGLQHTDIARLFSTFAFGDRVRLTFARSSYVVDANLVPDEYLFSNGTNGDLAVAVNPNIYAQFDQQAAAIQQNSQHIVVDQEYELITVLLKRGDQGFGFTISDSVAGQKVRKIQNNETCTNLRQGDILTEINGDDITKMTHKEVVERLKNCPAGQDVGLTVKRKKRFRSKTPMAMHTENDEYSLDSTPRRNCKTPSLDGLMLRRSANPNEYVSRALFSNSSTLPPMSTSQPPMNRFSEQLQPLPTNRQVIMERPQPLETGDYCSLPPLPPPMVESIYGVNPPVPNNELYYNQNHHHHHQQVNTVPMTSQPNSLDHHGGINFRPPSISASVDNIGLDNMTNSVNLTEASLPPMKFSNVSGLSQINQYNNFMNNDKLVMMQMQQQRYPQQMMQPTPPSLPIQNSDYHHMPLYSNSDILKAETAPSIPLPVKPIEQYMPEPTYGTNYQNNYYANNEEIALQRVQYGGGLNDGMVPINSNHLNHHQHHHHHQQQQSPSQQANFNMESECEEADEYEYHQVDLDRDNRDSNWGIRLIGGSEVDRAISIGSIVFGGAASKNGRLKSGDEIISINGYNVVGATHQHVVDLISACANRATLVVRRKKFAEACEVVLNRNMDEGFGFVIISSDNCALIGRIIEGSPADRCRQLHVRDRIIAVNRSYITSKMRHPEIVNMIKECGSTLRLRIIPADCYTVELIKSSQQDNFGFSMRGGSEYDGTPLYILRVAQKGLARDLLNVGDQIIEINGISTVGMTHSQAARIIKLSDPIVKLKLRRNYVIPPSLLVASPKELSKFNQVTAEMKTVNRNGTPSYAGQDGGGSASSEHGSFNQTQHSSLILDQQQSSLPSNNSMIYSPSLPLYAT